VISAAGSNFSRTAVITYLITLGAIFAASFFPEQRLWGLSWYGYFDWYLWLVLAVAVLIVPVVMFGWRQNYDRPDTAPSSGRSLSPLLVFLIIIVAGAAFYFFRCQTHFLGDGYQLLSWLQNGVNHKPWEKGTFLVLNSVYQLLGGTGESAARFALQIVSCSSGLILLLATAVTATRLYHTTVDRMLFILGIATGGYMLLFFGYFESYPLFVMSVGLFGQVGLLVERGRAPRWLPLIPLALAALFHIFAVVLIPAAIFILLHGSSWGNRIASMKRSTLVILSAGIVAVSLAVFFYLYLNSFFFRFTIVPLWPDQHTVEGYWLLSAKHLFDYANQLFLLLPGVLILVSLFFSARTRARVLQPDCLFLLFVLVPSLGLVFLINPGLGMPRDWDLFSFAGIPLTLLFYYLLLDRDGPRNGVRIAVLGITLGLLLLGPRVATQVDPELGVALFDRYAALDRIKNRTGRFILGEYLKKHNREDEARRRELQNNLVFPQEGWNIEGWEYIQRDQMDSAMMKFRQVIRFDPSFYTSLANLGVAYANLEQYDSALYYLEVAAARMPFNPDTYNNLGGVYYSMGDFDKAEKIWKDAIDLTPENFQFLEYLAQLYQQQNRVEDYEAILIEIAWLKEAPLEYVTRAAEVYLKRGQYEPAGRAFQRALSMGFDSAVVRQLQIQYPKLNVLR